MKYIRTLESLKEDKEELDQFRETIKMIFVDLIDEGFSPQILLQQRVKSRIKYAEDSFFDYTTRMAESYNQCNVVYIRLVRHKEQDEDVVDFQRTVQNNKSEEFKDKITDCFETLLALLDRRWNGAKIEKIVRQDAVTASDTYFHVLDERVWSRDFISIAITIVKKEI
jgi:pentose-5-phosphate-3-epimerase